LVSAANTLTDNYFFDGVVLQWFVSYSDHHTQFVRFRDSKSTPAMFDFGVPQGSVLGPLLFLLYTADLVMVIQSYYIQPHLYADDTHIYGFCQPGATSSGMSECFSAVADWISFNRLQLNATKMDIL